MMLEKRAFRIAGLLVFMAVALAGCRYAGEGLDNPLERRFFWFSFVAGDDIREACRAGTSDRYRFVYNGFWREQVRIYEFEPAGDKPLLRQRVILSATLSALSSDDLLAPWRGATAQTTLSSGQRDHLLSSLQPLFSPPPTGLRLPSDGFYWVVAACVKGRFVGNAWLFPSDDFAALTFPKELRALDRTDVPFKEADPFAYVGSYDQPHLAAERWYLTVGRDGISSGGF
ncbi:hypothetical protein [Telmatospirillum siberiense]|uniref:Lipoprotein n=1 Tax=Telmatospirillum siberiense TaxID=382514 RepID=A0A2N3PZN9_9PROT|nr:hypothetical protein [Telmatospirillum siberiense]PKU25872.1 hypothetical protein CWS72_04775 [Telmatospirillum siberiense]